MPREGNTIVGMPSHIGARRRKEPTGALSPEPAGSWVRSLLQGAEGKTASFSILTMGLWRFGKVGTRELGILSIQGDWR